MEGADSAGDRGNAGRLSERDRCARRSHVADADHGLRSPSLVPFVVVFLAVALIGELTCRPLQDPVNWWLSVACSLPLGGTIMHVTGVLGTRRRLAEPLGHIARIEDPITVVLPTIGRYDTVPACRRVVLSLVESLPHYCDEARIDVVIEEGAPAARALHELAAVHSIVRVLTIPAGYRTASGSRFKARANQYALERRTAEGESTPTRWILHMDDDTFGAHRHGAGHRPVPVCESGRAPRAGHPVLSPPVLTFPGSVDTLICPDFGGVHSSAEPGPAQGDFRTRPHESILHQRCAAAGRRAMRCGYGV